MPTPTVHPFPVKRPNFVEQANWLGPDDDLALQVVYTDVTGQLQSVQFQTKSADNAGEICLPASNDVATLGPRTRDVLAAHLRMACLLGGIAVPGSAEFNNVLADQANPANLQTAIGDVKITAVSLLNDQEAVVTFRQGNNGASRQYVMDHGELNRYTFAPSTQLFVIPGAVKKQFPNYVHDHPNTVLTTTQREDIRSYVLGLALWI